MYQIRFIFKCCTVVKYSTAQCAWYMSGNSFLATWDTIILHICHLSRNDKSALWVSCPSNFHFRIKMQQISFGPPKFFCHGSWFPQAGFMFILNFFPSAENFTYIIYFYIYAQWCILPILTMDNVSERFMKQDTATLTSSGMNEPHKGENLFRASLLLTR